MKTIDILVTVTYDDTILKAEVAELSVYRSVEKHIKEWGLGLVSFVHARELKGIR